MIWSSSDLELDCWEKSCVLDSLCLGGVLNLSLCMSFCACHAHHWSWPWPNDFSSCPYPEFSSLSWTCLAPRCWLNWLSIVALALLTSFRVCALCQLGPCPAILAAAPGSRPSIRGTTQPHSCLSLTVGLTTPCLCIAALCQLTGLHQKTHTLQKLVAIKKTTKTFLFGSGAAKRTLDSCFGMFKWLTLLWSRRPLQEWEMVAVKSL